MLTVFGILASLYFRSVIDDVVYTRALTSLTAFSIGILFLTLFQALVSAIRSHLVLYFSLKIDFNLIFSHFKHVLALPLSFFDTRKTGEILSRMEDSQKVRQAISEAVVSVIMDILMLAVVGVALFFQSFQLFWIALATVPISSAMVWGFSKKFARGYRTLMSESSEVQSYLVEAISGSGTVKAFNAESAVYREYEQRQHETLLLREKIASVEQAYGLMQQYTAEQASLLKEYRRLYEEHSITESAYEQINAEYALQVYLQAQAFWQLIAAKAEYLFL